MPNRTTPPDEALKEHFIIRDGRLWWNPALAKAHPRRVMSKPIGYGRNNKYPTVCVDGQMYHVHKLNYWLHTGDWPQACIYKDQGIGNTHIDNLDASTFSKVRAASIIEDRTYCITCRQRKDGKLKFIARTQYMNKNKHIGVFDTEEEAIEAAKAVRWLLFKAGTIPQVIKDLNSVKP